MRTTLNIDDDLMIRAKIRAAERRTTLTEVVEEALRVLLAAQQAPRAPVTLPTWESGGLAPGVDWDSNASILEFLESAERDDRGGS